MELASGVDALYLSGRADVPSELAELLEARRGEAAEAGLVPVELGGVEFAVAAHGFGKYRFCLQHRHGQVGITSSRRLPAVRVQPRTEFLHGVGPSGAVGWFDSVLSRELGPLALSASRLDLYADWQGWQLHGDQRRRFVCRADRRDTHERHDLLTGFEFGRRTTATICARIYDKTAEVDAKGHDFWRDIWGPVFDPAKPVLRVEFEFGRDGLRQFGIDTPTEAIDAVGALWASATSEWLTYRSPTADSERSRWPIAPEWRRIQRAAVCSGAADLERMYEGRRAGSVRTLMPALNGYLANLASLLGTVDIEDTCRALPALLRDYEQVSGRRFADRVAERRLRAAFS